MARPGDEKAAVFGVCCAGLLERCGNDWLVLDGLFKARALAQSADFFKKGFILQNTWHLQVWCQREVQLKKAVIDSADRCVVEPLLAGRGSRHEVETNGQVPVNGHEGPVCA